MKNPAVLLYTSDFITGTLFMSNEEVGAYIRLLCMQHQKGHLSKQEILQICKSESVFNSIMIHFKQDSDNLYFNERMDLEKEKRTKYSESRANNRKNVDNKQTCIYLMINKDNNLIKIGSSNNPQRRLLEIRNYYENKNIDLYAYCENKPQTLEKELHDLYKSKWCFDEWYSLDNEDIENIINNNDMKLHMNNHMKLHMNNHMNDDMNNHMENENENINIYINNNKELNNIFLEFLKIRKKLKAVNSDRAIKSLLKKLEPYDDETKYKMIEQSIIKSWKDIYELKNNYKTEKPLPEWFGKEIEEEVNKDAEEFARKVRGED